jgi:hypothetical protein
MDRVIDCVVDDRQGFNMWETLEEARRAVTDLVFGVRHQGIVSRCSGNGQAAPPIAKSGKGIRDAHPELSAVLRHLLRYHLAGTGAQVPLDGLIHDTDGYDCDDEATTLADVLEKVASKYRVSLDGLETN